MNRLLAIVALPFAALAMDTIPQSVGDYHYATTNGYPVVVNGGILPVRSVADRTLRGEDWLFLNEAVRTRAHITFTSLSSSFAYDGRPTMFQATNTAHQIGRIWNGWGRGYDFDDGSSAISIAYSVGAELTGGQTRPYAYAAIQTIKDGCGWDAGTYQRPTFTSAFQYASVSNLFAAMRGKQCAFESLPDIHITIQGGLARYLEYANTFDQTSVVATSATLAWDEEGDVFALASAAMDESRVVFWALCEYHTLTANNYPYDAVTRRWYAIVPITQTWETSHPTFSFSSSAPSIVSAVIAAASITDPRPIVSQGPNPASEWGCELYGVVYCVTPKHTWLKAEN